MNTSIIQTLPELLPSNIIIQMTLENLMIFADKLITENTKTTIAIQDSSPKPSELLTSKETMKILGIGKTTLWRWKKNYNLTILKKGKQVKYLRSEIESLFIQELKN